ncbi:MAG: hypothetical protein AAFX50_04490 [Acidobacteriota bacterium]
MCPSGDEGSGGGGTVCYNCTLADGDTHFKCKTSGSSSDECSIVFDNQGNRSCKYTGDDCS